MVEESSQIEPRTIINLNPDGTVSYSIETYTPILVREEAYIKSEVKKKIEYFKEIAQQLEDKGFVLSTKNLTPQAITKYKKTNENSKFMPQVSVEGHDIDEINNAYLKLLEDNLETKLTELKTTNEELIKNYDFMSKENDRLIKELQKKDLSTKEKIIIDNIKKNVLSNISNKEKKGIEENE